MDFTVIGFTVHKRTYDMDGSRALSKRSTAYVSLEGENVWEELERRTSRPSRLWHPVVLQALKDNGINVEKMAWNQYAGCGCPCSPGFSITGDTGMDYWVTLSAGAPSTDDPDEALGRRIQILANPTLPVGMPEQKEAAQQLLKEASR